MKILLISLMLLFPVTAWAVDEAYLYSGVKAADALIKTGSGVLHTVTCSSDAAATAGTLEIRDGIAAAGGTVIGLVTFIAAYFPPVTLIYDVKFGSGLFLDFTTTADVSCTASYR
jgi:hypothetical protein